MNKDTNFFHALSGPENHPLTVLETNQNPHSIEASTPRTDSVSYPQFTLCEVRGQKLTLSPIFWHDVCIGFKLVHVHAL